VSAESEAGQTLPVVQPADDATSTATVEPGYDIPAYPRGGDPARRIALHHRLVRQRRWSRELDALCRRYQ
jgi:hypothetical protein